MDGADCAGSFITEKTKINPHSVGNLERLAIVGASGMGALSYEPEYNISRKAVLLIWISWLKSAV